MNSLRHSRKPLVFALGVFVTIMLTNCAGHMGRGWERPDMDWEVHDPDRPQPPVVQPPTFGAQEYQGAPPGDAIVLYRESGDLSNWESVDGGPAEWIATNRYMEVAPGAGSIRTKQGFGDVQLHVEWAAPSPAEGEGQDRGNSGVFLMDQYEVQVLDCYNNTTYSDGMTAALYGQYPPRVNACRPPGQWQTYDIIFHRPRFSENGDLVQPATVHPDKMPIQLQDHSHPVQFRNIWVRELE